MHGNTITETETHPTKQGNAEQISTGGLERGRLRERQRPALRILVVQEPLERLVPTVLPIEMLHPRSSASILVLGPRFLALGRVQQPDGADLRRLLARFLLQAGVESVAGLPRKRTRVTSRPTVRL